MTKTQTEALLSDHTLATLTLTCADAREWDRRAVVLQGAARRAPGILLQVELQSAASDCRRRAHVVRLTEAAAAAAAL